MKKDLKFFMRPETKEEKTVFAPGPDSIPGEDGKPIMLEIRVLSNRRIRDINDAYRTRTMASDNRGNPLVANGEVVWKVEKDNQKASRHMIAEALVYPDLKDKDLMAFYDCHDITDMPDLVFPTADEYAHVSRVVMAALGLGPANEKETTKNADESVADAKN
ncbi:MAG: hypothetical protein RR949_03470 [Oscillospiraceae bacterium]